MRRVISTRLVRSTESYDVVMNHVEKRARVQKRFTLMSLKVHMALLPDNGSNK